MKRLSTLLAAALLLAGLASVVSINDPWPSGDPKAAVSLGKPASAAGCGDNGTWQWIGYSKAVGGPISGWNGTEEIDTDITMWTDGCGNDQARWSLWRPQGPTMKNYVLYGEVWRCGQSWIYVGGQYTVVWSGWYSNGGCGPQAANVIFLSTRSGTYAESDYAAYDAANLGGFYAHI